jgi:hypothetical protein
MPKGKREMTEALKPTIKVLILQEVRLLQMGRSLTPSFVISEISRSIQEAKGQMSARVRFMSQKERNALVKKMIRQSLDEEIDRATELRRERCFRCVHVRYFDGSGTSHAAFLCREDCIRAVGCAIEGQTPGVHCRSFSESSRGVSLGAYLEQMTLLYELREMFDEMEEVWDYLTK